MFGSFGRKYYYGVVTEAHRKGLIEFAEHVPCFQWTQILAHGKVKSFVPADNRRRLIADLGVSYRRDRSERIARCILGVPNGVSLGCVFSVCYNHGYKGSATQAR